jgi:hypothetical protein
MAAQSPRGIGGFALNPHIWNAASLEKPIGKSFVDNRPKYAIASGARVVRFSSILKIDARASCCGRKMRSNHPAADETAQAEKLTIKDDRFLFSWLGTVSARIMRRLQIHHHVR